MKRQKQGKPTKVRKKSPSTRRARNKLVAPRTADQYFAKSEGFRGLWDRVVAVISKMRSDRASLQQASREVGVSPRTVIRRGSRALRKQTNGRYMAKASDRLLRVLMIPTPAGTAEIVVPDSRQATLLAEYWNAVHRFFETGEASRLKKFHGKHITDANGAKILLTTDLAELNRLGAAGVLSFESLYARGT